MEQKLWSWCAGKAHQAEIKRSLEGEAKDEEEQASALRSAPGPIAVVQEVWAERGLLVRPGRGRYICKWAL